MNNKLTPIFKSNSWLLPFIIISLISITLSFFTRHFVVSEELVYNSLSERLPSERIEDAMANRIKYEWINYVLIPVIKFILFLITTIVILVGVHINSYKIAFKKILTVVVYSGFLFLLPTIIRIIYFSLFKDSFTLNDFQNFYPHSLLFYIDKSKIATWFYYPISVINIYEFVYWFFLAVGIKKVSDLSFIKSFILILQTYVLGFFIWVVFVVFISLNLS